MADFSDYAVVVGLECHVQLCTHSKLFSQAPNRYGAAPNTLVAEVDTGLPGSLPVLNRQAVECALRLGTALRCDIQQTSSFARKHYFYPDLPKGYQITQGDHPICLGGTLPFDGEAGEASVALERIHLEEDAGKNLHEAGSGVSYVDYNRAGAPLLEVVTKPSLHCAQDAMAAARSLRAIVMALRICDGNMQEGSLRIDVNVSVHKSGSNQLGVRTETKNLNSIRFLGQAVAYETRRQILQLRAGEPVVQETRLWDPQRKETRPLRGKEQDHDYRYCPEPDLPPLAIPSAMLEQVRDTQPELPQHKRERFCQTLGLRPYDAHILTSDQGLADYFETALRTHEHPKGLANWILNEVLRVAKHQESARVGDDDGDAFSCPIPPAAVASLVKLVDEGTISGHIAKQVFEELAHDPRKTPEEIVQAKGWHMQRDKAALQRIVQDVLRDHPREVTKYLAGKTRVMGYLMSQIMRRGEGRVDPKEATACLRDKLEEAREPGMG